MFRNFTINIISFKISQANDFSLQVVLLEYKILLSLIAATCSSDRLTGKPYQDKNFLQEYKSSIARDPTSNFLVVRVSSCFVFCLWTFKHCSLSPRHSITKKEYTIQKVIGYRWQKNYKEIQTFEIYMYI